ncbi:hypothetical protein AAG906_038309 [Vitis piasezkii]
MSIVVLMIEDPLVASMFFLVLAHGVHINKNSSCPTMWCDNIGVAYIAANPIAHANIKTHRMLQKELGIQYLPTKYQIAYVLTKPLSKSQFNTFKVKFNVKVSPFRLKRHVR